MTTKVAVIGATGRMGKLVLELVDAAQDLSLHAALDSKSELSSALGADVVFEVTKLEVSEKVADYCIANQLPLVIGTSGWSAAKLAQLEKQLSDAGNVTAVEVIPNFSIGSMLATKFAAEAAKHFETIEIIEAHHAGKLDSPSGTAVRNAEVIAEARGQSHLVPGVGQPARGQIVAGIPVHSLRLHGVSAKQDMVFGGNSEVLTISHDVISIASYSAGILASLRHAVSAKGLIVGLQAVLG